MPARVPLPPQLGRYQLLDPLGSGGMGTVYLAEDTLLSRKVALKVPHTTSEENPLVAQRFLREARSAAAIEHPNLCPIFDVGEVDRIQFLVMPFIEGKPLSKLIDEDHPWEPTRALTLVKKLAAALHVLHERGLIHRDLKPANVMIRPNGEPVVMDFGLVKSVECENKQLTPLGCLVGTPSYMAPEQIQRDRKALGPATDVYSLGVLLYELLTGVVPFVGPVSVVFGQILHAVPEAPSVRRPDLPAWLDYVCLKSLVKIPENRYPTMKSFIAALEPPLPFASTKYKSNSKAMETLPQPAKGTPFASPTREHVPIVDTLVCRKCYKVLKVPAGVEKRKLICPRCQEVLRRAEKEKLDRMESLDPPETSLAEYPTSTHRWWVWLLAGYAFLLFLLIGWQVFGSR